MNAKKKKQTRKKNGKPVRDAQVTIEVDAALKKDWNKTFAEFRAADREGTKAFDAKYEAVGRILEHDPPLYLADGVSTVGAFVKKHLPEETVRSVLRNVRVAWYASPEEEQTYGASKLDAALDYLEAKNGKPAHGRIPVDFAKLRIPARAGAASVPFADATVRQIQDATRSLGGGASGKRTKVSPVVAEIRRHVPSDAKEMTVHYANGYVSLGRIPARMFVAVLRAIAKARVPLEA